MKLLGHVSDLHLDDGPHALERAQRVFSFLDTLAEPLDALLVTGDIADHGLSAEYVQARSLLAGGGRVLTCPGNHDGRGAFRETLLDVAPSDDPINEVHDLGGLVIAMCDSTIPGRADGYLNDQTLAWLEEVLTATPDNVRALVAFHHPPALLHSPFIDAIRQRGEQRLAELLDRHPHVIGLLCPWEGRGDIDESPPPALAFHVVEEGDHIATHYRLVP